jgi:hypothetical protein
MGRPSIDPELMIRMLLIGYVYGIRSERRLVEEVHLNLAYRWFCGLGLRVADLLLQHPYIYLSLSPPAPLPVPRGRRFGCHYPAA